jgi:hypothetical protein
LALKAHSPTRNRLIVGVSWLKIKPTKKEESRL